MSANSFHAKLSGFNEVPPKLTDASGVFNAELSGNGEAIDYELTYSDLSTPATAAHIHFGQPGVNGGIMAFLCGGGGKPECPDFGGTVRGTITASDIMAIPDQGVTPGDLAGALRIIRAGLSYANLHSETFPEGEIRGQLR